MSRTLAALIRPCLSTTTTAATTTRLASTPARLCSSAASSKPAPPTKPSTTTPRASSPAMRELLQSIFSRNESWVHATETDEPELLAAMAKGQTPKILWIGCSDSRVPEGVVCQTKPGEIFVHRNIAGQFNQLDDSANSVLTYAVEVLGVEQSESLRRPCSTCRS
jgi:carbonic anhydrase